MRNAEAGAVTLVTGGTGLIGGEVVVEIARQGRPVRALVRGATDAEARRRLFARLEKSRAYRREFQRLIEPVTGDTTQPMLGASADRLHDIGTIIHCAANTQFSERENASVWNTNVTGARNLVAFTQAMSPNARLVFVSTASVVTAPSGTILREDAPFVGHTNTYVRSKREAEGIVQASRLDAVILRPSIVLSRGVDDRAMARSILWAVPIMAEVGDLPVEPDAHIDIVPVDHVANVIMLMATKRSLRHRVYHVSAGSGAHTFAELTAAMARENPELRRIHPIGRHVNLSNRTRERLLRPLGSYLPFINADVRYSTERLAEEIECAAEAPNSLSYVPDLVSQITLREAEDEMCRP